MMPHAKETVRGKDLGYATVAELLNGRTKGQKPQKASHWKTKISHKIGKLINFTASITLMRADLDKTDHQLSR